MVKNNLLKRPGLIVSILGFFGMMFSLTLNELSIFEKAIILIVCVLLFIGGALAETKIFDRFKDKHEENWS